MLEIVQFNFEKVPIDWYYDKTNMLWSCLKGVCDSLRLNQKKAKQRMDPKGMTTTPTMTTMGEQDMVYINEPNLYRLIIKSRRPEARRFEKWLFEEVLPSIRKKGYYSTQDGKPNELDFNIEKIVDNSERVRKDLAYQLKMVGVVQKSVERIETNINALSGNSKVSSPIRYLTIKMYFMENLLDFDKGKLISLGKKLAKEFREEYICSPAWTYDDEKHPINWYPEQFIEDHIFEERH
jgi:prophage antirepressor-like protein